MTIFSFFHPENSKQKKAQDTQTAHVVGVGVGYYPSTSTIKIKMPNNEEDEEEESAKLSESLTSRTVGSVAEVMDAISESYDGPPNETKGVKVVAKGGAKGADIAAAFPSPIRDPLTLSPDAAQNPPTLASAPTAAMSNIRQPPRQNSSTSTVQPPPPPGGLTRGGNVPSEPGAVAVNHRPLSNSTIQVGDAAGSSSNLAPQVPVVNAVLVDEVLVNMAPCVIAESASPDPPPPPSGEPVDAVPMTSERRTCMSLLTDFRVLSLVTLLLLVISGLLTGLLLAFAGDSNDNSVNENLASSGAPPTPPPVMVPTMMPTLAPVRNPTFADGTAKPTRIDQLALKPSTTPTTQKPTFFGGTYELATPSPDLTARPSNQPSDPILFGTKAPIPPMPAPTNPLSSKPVATEFPTTRPTLTPNAPTVRPTSALTKTPTPVPSKTPTSVPTKRPTLSPTKQPTPRPTTRSPTRNPVQEFVPVDDDNVPTDDAPVDDFVDDFVDDDDAPNDDAPVDDFVDEDDSPTDDAPVDDFVDDDDAPTDNAQVDDFVEDDGGGGYFKDDF
jgi:hypothetical protein